MKNIRKGKGYAWTYYFDTGHHLREQSGFIVDNLDSKHLVQAENKYEKVFIIARDALHKNLDLLMDKNERLQIAQDIADRARESGALRWQGAKKLKS